MTTRIRSRRLQQLRCAVCHDDRDPPTASCCACGTRYHPDCRQETGRCPTLACAAVWILPPDRPSNAWSVVVAMAFLFMLVGAGAIVRQGLAQAHRLLPLPPALSHAAAPADRR